MMISFLGLEDRYLLAIDKVVYHTTSIWMRNNKLRVLPLFFSYIPSSALEWSSDWEILLLMMMSQKINGNLSLNNGIPIVYTICTVGSSSLLMQFSKFLTWKRKKKSLSFKQKAAAHVCMYKMLTCSVHLAHINHKSLMNHFLACPWPCWECSVCRNQETCEAICCESAFDQFPLSSCHSASNITCTDIFHTHASVLNFGHRGTFFRKALEIFKTS